MDSAYIPIIIEATFNRSVKDVWSAITELDQMHQWYFDNIPAFEAVVGFEVVFDVVAPSRVFPHHWKVREAIPQQKISYDWHYGDTFPGMGLVTWELTDLDGSTKLTLTSDISKPFPSDIPEFKRESGEAGWNYFINERLKGYLDS